MYPNFTDPALPVREKKPQAAPKTGERGSGIAWGITIVSGVSLVLTLLGYGVAIAVETMFGIPHQSVYTSVLDLIGLSVYAILSIVLGIGKITWLPIIEQAWKPGILMGGALFLFMCSLIFVIKRVNRAPEKVDRLLEYLRPLKKGDTGGKMVGKSAAISLLFGGVIFITPFLIVGACMVAMVLISFIPMFGMQLGSVYFKEYVVSPTACSPIVSATVLQQRWTTPRKDASPAAKAATCVALLKDNTQVASGRVVVSTPAAVVLYEPASGAAWRVPTGDLTVQPVGTVRPVEADASNPAS